MRRRWRLAAVGVGILLLLAGCGDSPQSQIEELFARCIDEGGGTAGDFELLLGPDSQILVVAGDVQADDDLLDRCRESFRRLPKR